jgi:FRG domain
MNIKVSGQWRGTTADGQANIVLELDENGDRALGHGYYFPLNFDLPGCFVHLDLPISFDEYQVIATASYVNPFNGLIYNPIELESHFRDYEFPRQVNIQFRQDGTRLQIRGITGDQTQLATVKKDKGGKGSSVVSIATVTTWPDFKEYVRKLDPRTNVFRGQSKPYRLATSFHRTSRKDLYTYLSQDVNILHRALTARTKHIFDLNRPQELGAFLNLAQHHGFPTPLLDWTYSPYVAAYFAFSDASNETYLEGNVRIFILDRIMLERNSPQIQALTFVMPHLSILEALSIENERATPQQGLLTVTNAHDIERFVHEIEIAKGIKILQAIDLPRSLASEVLAELRLMGITRSAMFPGIDSICDDLRERLFSLA